MTSLVVLCSVALFLGCGGKGPDKIEGSVSVQGKKLTSGNIIFWDATQKKTPFAINPNGSFDLLNLAPGKYTVTLESTAATKTVVPGPATMPKGAPATVDPTRTGEGGGKAVPIPDKYKDPKTGLAVEITAGQKKLEVDFK